jgi:hypothetical protein
MENPVVAASEGNDYGCSSSITCRKAEYVIHYPVTVKICSCYAQTTLTTFLNIPVNIFW